MSQSEVIRVFVGTDRSQQLAVPVLEYSIKRHTSAKVEVIPMMDLPVPEPKDPRNGQRTGFSFSRFCIPKLAGYKGKAIYMDADMLVFNDIRELWNIPFDGAKVVIQQEVKFENVTTQKVGAPKKRKKQCAVMLLDCERLDWDIQNIVAGMDAGEYDYEQLMYDLCILEEKDIKYGVPFEWNSLEHWEPETRLIHYTDVYTQPWTECGNKFGYLWFHEVRKMISEGMLDEQQIRQEVDLGYFRPSLINDVKYRHFLPSFLLGVWDKRNSSQDKLSGYVKHRDVYEAKRRRQKAIKEFEALQAVKNKPIEEQFEIYLAGNAAALNILIFTEHINATYFISFDIPLKQLHAEGEVNFAVASQEYVSKLEPKCWEAWADKFKPDFVVLTRYGHESGTDILNYFKSLEIPVIYHIDDDLLDVPTSLGAEIQERQGNPLVVETRRALLESCDLIYASTHALSKLMQAKFPDQKVFYGMYAPYLADLVEQQVVGRSNGFVLGYMGSKGHQHDLELVVPALEKILDEREDVSFEVFGSIKMPAELERFGARVRSHGVQKSYLEFLCTLSSLNWDVGLAPLVNEPFNLCKAPTKFIEYTASNIPVIASKVLVYEDALPINAGLFVEDEWYQAIKLYINDANLRLESLRVAKEYCESAYSVSSLKQQVLKVLELAK